MCRSIYSVSVNVQYITHTTGLCVGQWTVYHTQYDLHNTTNTAGGDTKFSGQTTDVD